MFVSLVLACTSSSNSDRGPVDPPVETADTSSTGDTGPSETACADRIPAADTTWSVVPGILTEEDFDFDASGLLLAQDDTSLRGYDRDGTPHLLATSIGVNATGIRSLASGLVVVLQPNTATAHLVDLASGAVTVLANDLWGPNGLDAAEDGLVYLSENTTGGRLLEIDPTTGASSVVVVDDWMNGIVLSPDERTLYYTTAGYYTPPGVRSISRDASGAWDRSTVRDVWVADAFVGGITIDACGTLYAVEYRNGIVWRIEPATGAAEALVDFDEATTAVSYPSLHFSPGLGGWDAGSLFVSSRSIVYEIPTGIPGSHVLAP